MSFLVNPNAFFIFIWHLLHILLKLNSSIYIIKNFHFIGKRTKEDLDMPLFDFVTIVRSTNNFSCTNKIGEGGFGPVYKVI